MNYNTANHSTHVTIAICTWNRAKLLDQTLEQMCKLYIPHGVEWELLVVNNNCTDETDRVILRYADRLPIRRLFEPNPGKSHALNHAVREARGDYIIWTDDDALVDSQWLQSYFEAFNRWPEAAIFGGPVEPWFESEPPSWLTEAWPQIAAAYAVLDLGKEAAPLTEKRVPFGVNLAFRTSAQALYSYDPELGPNPNNTIRGEETTLIRRMLAAGEVGRWVPGARIRHFIPSDRLTTQFLWELYYGYGQFNALKWHEEEIRRMESQSAPLSLYLLRREQAFWLMNSLRWEAMYRLWRLFCKPKSWVLGLINAALCWGRLRGLGDLYRQHLIANNSQL